MKSRNTEPTIEATGRSPRLPVRHPDADLFICDFMDAIPKDDMSSMEHPVFSLSTKPDTRTRRYEHNGKIIEIVPSGIGLATIHDKDILIFCISQLVTAMNEGKEPSRKVTLKAFDLLVSCNRKTDGHGYRLLKNALRRLRGTTIETNIKTGGKEETDGFGLIEDYKIVRESFGGRMQELEITLSEWFYRSVTARNVLTLHPDYFQLRKPCERRMYELARKHCGMQDEWSISLPLLQKKCGSNSPERVFRSMVKKICEDDTRDAPFPDYEISMADDLITFTNRSALREKQEKAKERREMPQLGNVVELMNDVRTVAPGYDPYGLLDEWVNWWNDSGAPDLKNARAAFIGFCKKRHEKRPLR